MHKTLTIAGSDSGGGAGVQADLKTFHALGCYGTSVITAVTAQNTVHVTRIQEMTPDMVREQLHAVLEDFGIEAIKTGMLVSAETIGVVSRVLQQFNVANLVVDPVISSSSGTSLLTAEGIAALKRQLLPLALLATPNIPEAEILSGITITGESSMRTAAEIIHADGTRNVLIKGGHVPGDTCVDTLYDGTYFRSYAAPRVDTQNTHGTGCTYSAAITAFLAHGHSLDAAITRAKAWLQRAIETAPNIGRGNGPLNHMHDQNQGIN